MTIQPPPPPPKPGELMPVRKQQQPMVPFAPQNSLAACISDPADLIACFDDYELDCEIEEKPLSLNGFLAHAQRPLGITRRWWGRHSRGDKDASKLPGLKEAVEAIETRIAGRLDEDGLAGKVHPGMAAQTLKMMDDRDALAAEKEAAAQTGAQETQKEQMANILHPDCTHDQLVAIEAAGLKPLLYTQQQLEAGLPWIMPKLPDA